MKHYYKVVYKIDEKYFSCWAEGDDKVEYKLNEWVESSKQNKKIGYHLLIFNNKENAIEFVKNVVIPYLSKILSSLLVFECFIENKVKFIPPRKMDSSGYIYNCLYDRNWPKGTLIAEKVKIYGKPIFSGESLLHLSG